MPNSQIPEVPETPTTSVFHEVVIALLRRTERRQAGKITFDKFASDFVGLTGRRVREKNRQPDGTHVSTCIAALRKALGDAWRDEYAEQLRAAATQQLARLAQAPVPARRAAMAQGAMRLQPDEIPHPEGPLNAEQVAALKRIALAPVVDPVSFALYLYAKLRLGRLGLLDEGSLSASFVNLQMRPRRGVGLHEAPPAPCSSLDELLSQHPGLPAWVLIGAPGGGKSTLLMHRALHSAYRVLTSTATAGGAERPELALHLRLANYPAAADGGRQPSLTLWVEDQIRRGFVNRRCGDQIPTLDALRERYSIRLLLDGLNEVQGAQRDAAQQHLMEEAARWSEAGEPAPLFTVRSLDHQPLGTGRSDGLPAGEVDVLPWEREQIREYCQRHPAHQVRALWEALEQHPQHAALLALYANPFNLRLQCDLFVRDQGRLSANRGELMGRIGLLKLNELMPERHKRLPALPPDVLHPADPGRIAVQAGRPDGALHRLVLQGSLLNDWRDLGRRWHEHAGADWYHAPLHDPDWRRLPGAAQETARALHLIDEDSGKLRFAHQLWQEYFAAHALATCEPASWPDLSPPQGSGHDLGVGLWQLPQPQPSKWDQCAQLAVQIAADPEPLLCELTESNLALAARAAHSRGLSAVSGEGGAPVAPARLREIKHRLLDRSLDTGTPLPLRIEAGELLGLLGDDIRYEEREGPGREAGRPGPRYRLPRPAWQSDSSQSSGPGWVDVPAGRWVVNADDKQVEVEVPPDVKLAFAPVTNAEFKCFVDDHGYGRPEDAEPPPWWVGQAAHEFWRHGLPNVGIQNAWKLARDLLQGKDDNVFVNAKTPAEREQQLVELQFSGGHPDEVREDLLPKLKAGNDEFDAWVAEQGKPQRHRFAPECWHAPRYTNPLQPVVGVSVFEAEAYCRWLSVQMAGLGWRVCLPTEAVWAVAAQGGGARPLGWPWADEPVGGVDDARWHDHINYMHTRSRRTTPVAVFPKGRSAAGCFDLAGQVWEWMSNLYDDGVAGPAAGDDADWLLARAVRGGTWFGDAQVCRPADRTRFRPGDRNLLLGFRVLCCPILDP